MAKTKGEEKVELKPARPQRPRLSTAKKDAVAHYAADGMHPKQIAEKMKLHPGETQRYIRSDEGIDHIKQIRDARMERARARMEYIAEPAIAALAQTITGQIESKVRLAAIDSLLDRVGLSREVRSKSESKSTQLHAATSDRFHDWSEQELRRFVETGEEPE